MIEATLALFLLSTILVIIVFFGRQKKLVKEALLENNLKLADLRQLEISNYTILTEEFKSFRDEFRNCHDYYLKLSQERDKINQNVLVKTKDLIHQLGRIENELANKFSQLTLKLDVLSAESKLDSSTLNSAKDLVNQIIEMLNSEVGYEELEVQESSSDETVQKLVSEVSKISDFEKKLDSINSKLIILGNKLPNKDDLLPRLDELLEILSQVEIEEVPGARLQEDYKFIDPFNQEE